MNPLPVEPWTPPLAESPLAGYAVPPDSYDELFSGTGAARPHGESFVALLAALGVEEFARRRTQAERLMHDDGVAFSPYGDPGEQPRPWRLDALPVLIAAAEWRLVAAALAQRARLLDQVLADLYGPQTLLLEGLLPPEFLYANPAFHRAYQGQRSAGQRHLAFYAADLARAADGSWRVLADRTEAPSGSGYALQNRIVLSRVIPGVFHHCQVERLAGYFIALRDTLQEAAPRHRDNPQTVLLSPGPKSPTYFEDAYLARYLGYTLVEGGDLAVRNSQVMLKTLGGLIPVDVVLRRPNSDLCDPLELAADSADGVAGLLQASRRENVAIANTLGTGLVEMPVLMAFLPQIARSLLGEELLLPGLATWWCGDAASRNWVLANLDGVTIRPAFRRRGQGRDNLHCRPPHELAALIQAHPQAYVAQERVAGSTTPVQMGSAVERGRVRIRSFAVASGEGYTVLSGGLAHVNLTHEADILTAPREVTKDTWIISDGPVAQVTLLHRSDQPVRIRRSGAEFPSRVADNLYWLGRHIERADAAARLLRTTALRLTGEADAASLVELPALLRGLAEQGLIEPGFAVDGIRQRLPTIEESLPALLFDECQAGSLRSILNAMFGVASLVRDRISIDSWRIVHRIDQQFRLPGGSPLSVTDMLPMVERMIIELAAFSGLVMESMTRSQAWRFLDMGRRVERALQMIRLVRTCLVESPEEQASVLEAVLEAADSIMTYRSRYLGSIHLVSVLDLLLVDETNPRSVAYQLAALNDHVESLPHDPAQALRAPEQRLAMSVLYGIRMLDVEVEVDAYRMGQSDTLDSLLNGLEDQLPQLSDLISHKYLIHAGPSQQLSDIRPITRPAGEP